MKPSTIIPLVVVGALLGAGAHWLKSEAEATNRIISNQPNSGYQACQELNTLLIAAGKNNELHDCDREYLDR
jgi:hypothetical protein